MTAQSYGSSKRQLLAVEEELSVPVSLIRSNGRRDSTPHGSAKRAQSSEGNE
jgi:hypothetical protein